MPKVACSFCQKTKKAKTHTNHYIYPRRVTNGSCSGGYTVVDEELIIPKRWREFVNRKGRHEGYACPECIASTKDVHIEEQAKTKQMLKAAKKEYKHFLANEWMGLDLLIKEEKYTYQRLDNSRWSGRMQHDAHFRAWCEVQYFKAAGSVQRLKNKESRLRSTVRKKKEEVEHWNPKRLVSAIPVLQSMHSTLAG